MPALRTAVETESLAIVTGGDDLSLSVPDQAHEGKKLRADADHGPGGLVGAGGIDNGDAAIVGGKGERVAAGGECHGVDPASRVIQELSTHSVEGKPLSPDARVRPAINTLDEAGEDSRMCVGRAGGKKDRVRVPGHRGDRALDGLFQMLGHPPVILLLEVADRNDPIARTDGELGLRRGPANKRSSPVDSEEDKGWFIPLGRGFPD